jgi:hypothetical protein
MPIVKEVFVSNVHINILMNIEISTVVLLCLFQGLVAGLLRPRPSLKQIEQNLSSGKFCEWHKRQVKFKMLCSFCLSSRCPADKSLRKCVKMFSM